MIKIKKKDDKKHQKNWPVLARYFKDGENYVGHLSKKTKVLARILEQEKSNEKSK